MKNNDFRNSLTAAIVLLLGIYGPVDHSNSSYFLIRLGYLIFFPILIWFGIGWLWKRFNLTERLEQILSRILFFIFGSSMIFLAVLEFNAKTHVGNTQYVQTRDGVEDVGEDIVLNGPDYRLIILYLVVAIFFFWISISYNNIGKKRI